MKRTCPECFSEFETTHSHKKFCSPPCQIVATAKREWAKKKVNFESRCSSLFYGAKNRAVAKNVPFDISIDYLIELWKGQDGVCAITHIPFDLSSPAIRGEPRFNAPSLDRIVPALGYVKGNVRLVLYQINCAIGPYGLERFLETIRSIN